MAGAAEQSQEAPIISPPDTAAAPAPATISESKLNQMIMEQLRARPRCADARSIMLELVDEAEAPCNWRIGHFDPGRGDRYVCKATLRRIYDAIGSDFVMVGQS